MRGGVVEMKLTMTVALLQLTRLQPCFHRAGVAIGACSKCLRASTSRQK
jgi:hypothetical protein